MDVLTAEAAYQEEVGRGGYHQNYPDVLRSPRLINMSSIQMQTRKGSILNVFHNPRGLSQLFTKSKSRHRYQGQTPNEHGR
jgi:hypothetical protein